MISLIFAIFTGNIEALGSAVLDGAASAVQVLLSLCGMMCLWCGMMQVLSQAGLIRRLAKLLSPLLRIFFPTAYRTGEGIEEISANISANLLGIGNAATPFALRAMEQMQKHNPIPEKADPEQITLAVLNTASVSLIPANLLALRRAAGSENPYAVMIPVWVVSLLCAGMSLLLTSLPRWFDRILHKRNDRENSHG
ncbi:MAG: spore maturation protein A [Clostridia bacterium]|nr:spore maturation protein A [Clostridia bacterium]